MKLTSAGTLDRSTEQQILRVAADRGICCRQLAALLREAGTRRIEAKAVTTVTTDGGTRRVRRTVLRKG